MTEVAGHTTRRRSGARRKRHWLRWAIVSATAIVMLVVLAAAIAIRLRPVPAPLRLPDSAAGPPAGRLNGAWSIAAGSLAGFRVGQTVLGLSTDSVGRTSAVTGSVALAGDRVVRATFRIDLTTIKVTGTQFAQSLDTSRYPIATITLAHPLALGRAFGSGATVRTTAAGRLTMHGISRPVIVTLWGRCQGWRVQAAGSIPIVFSRWRIARPTGFGFLASLASHGVAEFRLVLRRADGS